METNFANTPIDPAVSAGTDMSYANQPYGGPFTETVQLEGTASNDSAIQGTTL